MKNYRFTFPLRYPPGIVGHNNPKERLGYYQQGSDPEDARHLLAEHLQVSPDELELDEFW